MRISPPRYSLLYPLGYIAGITLLSSIPETEHPANVLESLLNWTPPELQNLLHVPLYAGLCWLWTGFFASKHWPMRVAVMLAVSISALFGLFDEWHQSWVPGRHSSLTDATFNTLGAVVGAAWFMRQRASEPAGDTTRKP